MPRHARLLFAGHPLHVVHRGVNRGACFADDADRSFYLGLLQELLRKRTGPLWEGRFKSSLVDSTRYALSCHRYVEENPVRAGIVRHPGGYPWSSFRANAMGYTCAFLTPHASMEALHADPVERLIAYRAMFDAPQPEKEVEIFRTAIKSGLAAGAPDFIERVASASGRRATRRNAWPAPA